MSGVFVTLKLATSLDGRIALSDGTSQWITSAESRARGHELRANHDAILVGSGTVRADDPLLTARTAPPPKKQPIRIVADSAARLSPESRLAQSAGLGRVVVAAAVSGSAALAEAGVEVWRCGEADCVSPALLLSRAQVEGVHSILLEGGGRLAASFLKEGLIDQISWFRAPIIIGGDGLAAIGALGLKNLSDASGWRLAATERIGPDALDTYIRV